MDETFTLRELLNFLRSKRVEAPDVQEPSRKSGRSLRGKMVPRRGVVSQITNLYHDKRDVQVITMVNEIVGRSAKAREDGEATSADRYATTLADQALIPLLRKKGCNVPKGYRFQDFRQDWSNVRCLLALKGYANMRIYDTAKRAVEMAKEQAKGIIREVEKELNLRAA